MHGDLEAITGHKSSVVLSELVDPAQKLLEPSTTPRGKRPLLIPDFVSSLPVVLEGDRETVLGASGGTQIALKTSHEKKPQLTNITFPQWSAANFRIMQTLGNLEAITGHKSSVVLSVYPRKEKSYTEQLESFKPVKLLFSPTGHYKLQVFIYQTLEKGTTDLQDKATVESVIDKLQVESGFVMCPGLLDYNAIMSDICFSLINNS